MTTLQTPQKAALCLTGTDTSVSRVLDAIRRQADLRQSNQSFQWLRDSLQHPVWEKDGCWLEIQHPHAKYLADKLVGVASAHGVKAWWCEGGRPSASALAEGNSTDVAISDIAKELKVSPKRFPRDILLRAKELMDFVLSGAPLRDLDGKWLYKDKSVLSLKLGRSYRMIFRKQSDGSLRYESVMTHESYNKSIC